MAFHNDDGKAAERGYVALVISAKPEAVGFYQKLVFALYEPSLAFTSPARIAFLTDRISRFS